MSVFIPTYEEFEHALIDKIYETPLGGMMSMFAPNAYTAMHNDIDFKALYNKTWTPENMSNNYRRRHGLPVLRKQAQRS